MLAVFLKVFNFPKPLLSSSHSNSLFYAIPLSFSSILPLTSPPHPPLRAPSMPPWWPGFGSHAPSIQSTARDSSDRSPRNNSPTVRLGMASRQIGNGTQHNASNRALSYQTRMLEDVQHQVRNIYRHQSRQDQDLPGRVAHEILNSEAFSFLRQRSDDQVRCLSLSSRGLLQSC
jgi:hypothetical protein